MSIFKAYDIRGIYGKDFDKDTVYKIGYFLPKILKSDRVLVGYDVRLTSKEIFETLSAGITDSGADVFSIGLSTTPMVYYATAKHDFDASIQITASHNPKEYNGFKVSKTSSLPVGYDTGLKDLEKMVMEGDLIHAQKKGTVHVYPVKDEYAEFLKGYLSDISVLKIGIDCSNGSTAEIIKDIMGVGPLYINDAPDGTFPGHEPNPLEQKNVEGLKKLVVDNSCDIGIIYDGDGDRVIFVDEKGSFIPPDLIIGVIANYYLSQEKGNVLHDIRTSRGVSEYIRKLGGTPHMWKVGHAFAKIKLREIGGIFGGELAGHYYFRDFFNCDSGIFASLIVLNVLNNAKREGKTFSSLIKPVKTYANSGEINFRIEDKKGAMEALKEAASKDNSGTVYDFDGYRIEFEDWWFNVRPSNTEPYLRLVVEAKDEEMLKEKLSQLTNIIDKYK